jgi:hypothetical protein
MNRKKGYKRQQIKQKLCNTGTVDDKIIKHHKATNTVSPETRLQQEKDRTVQKTAVLYCGVSRKQENSSKVLRRKRNLTQISQLTEIFFTCRGFDLQLR